MDFAKYCRLLATSELFFCRANRLGDAYEGAFPVGNQLMRAAALHQYETDLDNSPFKDWPREFVLQFLARQGSRSTEVLENVVVNCWHMNEIESAAMWLAYGRDSNAIAITSTYARLRAQLHPLILMTEVQYVDYATAYFPTNNAFWSLVHKRMFFASERELRALVFSSGLVARMRTGCVEYADGLGIRIDLVSALEGVHVSPSASDWFFETVQSVTSRFAPMLPVRRSGMNSVPIY